MLGLLGFVGCSGSGPDVNYVEGVVTVNGTPTEGVTVGFSPVDPATGVAAVGTTDANGVFRLTAMQGGEPEEGTTAGEYFVTFMKNSISTLSAEDAQKMQDDPNYGKTGSGLSPPPKVESAIPATYGKAETSGFKVTVADGENKGDAFKFDLKK